MFYEQFYFVLVYAAHIALCKVWAILFLFYLLFLITFHFILDSCRTLNHVDCYAMFFILSFYNFLRIFKEFSRTSFALYTELCKDLPDLNLNFPFMCLADYDHMFLHEHSTALHSIFSFLFENCTALHCILHSLVQPHISSFGDAQHPPFFSLLCTLWIYLDPDQSGPNRTKH